MSSELACIFIASSLLVGLTGENDVSVTICPLFNVNAPFARTSIPLIPVIFSFPVKLPQKPPQSSP